LVWDDNAPARQTAEAEGFEVVNFLERDWSDIEALVLSPGAPLTVNPHRAVELARLTQTPVIGDIEIFARALAGRPAAARGQLVGITGTNGKSTTTALIGHILKGCGRHAQVGGNIGTPALDLAPPHPGAIYVLELSSFQLDLTESLKPTVAVLLNLAEDHLDRHGDMAAYIAAKMRIFANQSSLEHAVIGVDDPYTQRILSEMRAERSAPALTPISAGRALGRGVHAVGGVLYDALDGRATEVVDLRRARSLIGRHNWQNAAAAYAATRLLGLDSAEIAREIVSFPGLPHRMEVVAGVGEVQFINDSKATNPASTRQALAALENVFWIAGGRSKGANFAELGMLMPRVAKAYLIGEAAETIASQLKGKVITEICRDMKTAVRRAAADAAEARGANPVVMLSPACASFDQYQDFAARGDDFRQIVLDLPGAEINGQAA
ncbi:MAG: UDP-N-acetylmuramoyl-L-alanine--D-glutamate ligase, partial [Maricaulaceae bacterium]